MTNKKEPKQSDTYVTEWWCEYLPVVFSVAHRDSAPRSYWGVEPHLSELSESSLQHWKTTTNGISLKIWDKIMTWYIWLIRFFLVANKCATLLYLKQTKLLFTATHAPMVPELQCIELQEGTIDKNKDGCTRLHLPPLSKNESKTSPIQKMILTSGFSLVLYRPGGPPSGQKQHFYIS